MAPTLAVTTPAGDPLSDAIAEAESAWEEQCSDWDATVAGPPTGTSGSSGTGLWGGMPAVDSKAIARMAPIFEKHFGGRFEVKHIRPGGYSTVRDAIIDIVTKMRAAKPTAVH